MSAGIQFHTWNGNGPKGQKTSDIAEENNYMSGDSTMISLGRGVFGAALKITEDLKHGMSCPVEIFQNENLAGSISHDFDIEWVEVWGFGSSSTGSGVDVKSTSKSNGDGLWL